jgi:hypothetical protein
MVHVILNAECFVLLLLLLLLLVFCYRLSLPVTSFQTTGFFRFMCDVPGRAIFVVVCDIDLLRDISRLR